MKTKKSEPKLFGLHHCRICDYNYDLEDMSVNDTGICIECEMRIEQGLIDKYGREID